MGDDEDQIRGIIDLLNSRAYTFTNDVGTDIIESDIPADYIEKAAAARESLIEGIVETDDALMEKYLKSVPTNSRKPCAKPSAM